MHMGFLKVVREWIISVISQAELESHGPVTVTVEDSTPLPPTDPPHLCAYEAQRVEMLGAQLDAILDQYQTAVEAFTACMESTLKQAVASDFNLRKNHLDHVFKYMKQNLTASRAILKKMRSAK
jgi:hypothetical protein